MLVERWDGQRWSIQHPPSPTRATSSGLTAVSCPAPTVCTAAGTYSDRARADQTLVERWNGIQWSIQATPRHLGSTAARVTGVSCSTSEACTLVGSYFQKPGDGCCSGPLPPVGAFVDEWTGQQWASQRVPTQAGGALRGLAGVACFSPTACTAVGLSPAGPLVEHWNGKSWSAQLLGGGAANELAAVACPSPAACTVVGVDSNSALAEGWNGTSWSVQVTPNPTTALRGSLTGVSCVSTTMCTAVGSHDNPGRGGGGEYNLSLVERWDGAGWSIQQTPNPSPALDVRLTGISCASLTSCAVVGAYYAAPGGVEPFAESWDGTNWAIQPTPNPPIPSSSPVTPLAAVSCASADVCAAVGAYDNFMQTFAEGWNGSSWSIQPTANPPSRTPFGTPVRALAGVSCPALTSCTAVGSYDSGKYSAALAEDWDGHTWSIQSTPGPAGATNIQLKALSCASPGACTAVGNYESLAGTFMSLIERWDGSNWSIQPSPTPSGGRYVNLVSVSCASTTACTAVGNYGLDPLIETWDGTTWSIQPAPSGAAGSTLAGVSCSSPTACIAVGTNAAQAPVSLVEP